MTDLTALMELLDKNDISYDVTKIFDNFNRFGYAIWFNQGHVEFDEYGKLTNVVTY